MTNPAWPMDEPPYTLENIHQEGHSWVWFWLIENGGGDLELDWVGCDDEDLPKWMSEEIDQSGWDFFWYPSCSFFNSEDTSNFAVASWALENGIAPYQPFRIVMDQTRYFRSGGWEYPDEWDCETDWELDKVIPISAFEASRRWEWFLQMRRMSREIIQAKRDWIRYQHKTNPKCWYIKYDGYWSTNYYYDGQFPDGTVVSLRSAFRHEGHHYWTTLASGRSHGKRGFDADREAAWEEMVQQAIERIPGTTRAQLKKLPVRSYG